MPEGLQFRGKYVAKTRNKMSQPKVNTTNDIKSSAPLSRASRMMTFDEENISKKSIVVNQGPQDRSSSQVIFFRKGKHQTPVRRYLPEDYFKRVGFKYNQNTNSRSRTSGPKRSGRGSTKSSILVSNPNPEDMSTKISNSKICRGSLRIQRMIPSHRGPRAR
jgi:hypothetical protein